MDFPPDARKVAGKLLLTVGTDLDHTERLGKTIAVEFNPNSGYTFLIDDSFSVAMLDGDILRDWVRCSCGSEGFVNTLKARGFCCEISANEFEKCFSDLKEIRR